MDGPEKGEHLHAVDHFVEVEHKKVFFQKFAKQAPKLRILDFEIVDIFGEASQPREQFFELQSPLFFLQKVLQILVTENGVRLEVASGKSIFRLIVTWLHCSARKQNSPARTYATRVDISQILFDRTKKGLEAGIRQERLRMAFVQLSESRQEVNVVVVLVRKVAFLEQVQNLVVGFES